MEKKLNVYLVRKDNKELVLYTYKPKKVKCNYQWDGKDVYYFQKNGGYEFPFLKKFSKCILPYVTEKNSPYMVEVTESDLKAILTFIYRCESEFTRWKQMQLPLEYYSPYHTTYYSSSQDMQKLICTIADKQWYDKIYKVVNNTYKREHIKELERHMK